MKGNTVVFIGHNDITGLDIKELEEKIIALIEKGYMSFVSGGMGGFDRVAAGIVHKLKTSYPQIMNYLVIPYLNFKIFDQSIFDEIIIPEGFENTPYKAAIVKRNRYMADISSVAVCFVHHSFGGAAKTLEYAKRKGVICY